MDPKAIKVLLIEDNEGDATLIKDFLNRTRDMSWEIDWAQRLSEGLSRAAVEDFDIVLLDLSLPDSRGIPTFLRAYEALTKVPIILLTGLDDEDIVMEAAQRGAQDYLVKGKVTRELLVRSIKYAIERHRLSEELKQESQAKSMVLSTATHELKTPLTSIVGYVDRILLSRDTVGPLNERQSRYLETVKKNAHRLKVLVDDLLDISRIEAGGLELNVAEVDVRQEVEEAFQNLQQEINEKGLTVVVKIPEGTCRVLADRLRFSQVIGNLVSNACKYSMEGSTVTVTSLELEKTVQIDVTDTGIGISQADQFQLFDKFFRADNTLTRKESGTGLGLYITKHLIEAHHGSIRVQSEPGKGTTFSLTWPKAEPVSTSDQEELPSVQKEASIRTS